MSGKWGMFLGRVRQRQVFSAEAAIGHASERGPDIPRAGRIWRRQGEVGNPACRWRLEYSRLAPHSRITGPAASGMPGMFWPRVRRQKSFLARRSSILHRNRRCRSFDPVGTSAHTPIAAVRRRGHNRSNAPRADIDWDRRQLPAASYGVDWRGWGSSTMRGEVCS